MNKLILTILITIISCIECFAQDVITKKNNEIIEATVIEVSAAEIKYTKYKNRDSTIYTILKSDVIIIRYEDGMHDIFNEAELNKNITPQASNDLFKQGQKDAYLNYTKYRSFKIRK